MFYFYHGTNIDNLKNILDSGYIYSSNQLDEKYIRIIPDSQYIYCNIIGGTIIDKFKKIDELIGLGEISIIIDPIILNYKTGYLNFGWSKEQNNKSIKLNKKSKIDDVINKLINIYRYPYVMTHEVLFKNKINNKFIVGIVINKYNDKYKKNYIAVKKLLQDHGLANVKIFNHMPKLLM